MVSLAPKQQQRATSSCIHRPVPLWLVLVIILVVYGSTLLYVHQRTNDVAAATTERFPSEKSLSGRSSLLGGFTSTTKNQLRHLNSENNVRIPTNKEGGALSLEDRLRLLELKVNAFMNFGVKDPFFGGRIHNYEWCQKKSNLQTFGCKEGWEAYLAPDCPGGFDHPICLDDLPPPIEETGSDGFPIHKPERQNECLVYDFGIRANPQIGAVMARTFGCEVHAFDPSPISKQYFAETNKESEKLRSLPNYHFHPYGAGGTDDTVQLFQYDWGQVSNIRYPSVVLECDEDNKTGKKPDCARKQGAQEQTSFRLPVKTLPTIIKELGHVGRTIDVLKIDVEGSEFNFLEQLLDATGGCPDFIQQITVEWHHYSFDERFGGGSSPPINAIVTLLNACGFELMWQHLPEGWLSSSAFFKNLGMNNVRYNLQTFIRIPKGGGGEGTVEKKAILRPDVQ